jgi:nucleoid DNA-binding protein
MTKVEMIEALTTRAGLSEQEAKRTAQVIDEVLADQGASHSEKPLPPPGEFFKDAIVTESTGILKLRRRPRRERQQPGGAF